MKRYAKFFVFWTLSLVIYVLFFFVFRPDVDCHGSSLIKFNEDKLCYEACVEGKQRRIDDVEDVTDVPLHDGMRVYYLKLVDNADVVYRAEDCPVEKWAMATHFVRWSGMFWAGILAISLSVVLMKMVQKDRKRC